MEQEHGQTAMTKLAPYRGSTALSNEQATEILKTIWPKAPDVEIWKAANICQTYGLNPLMKHLALLPFNKKDKTGKIIAIEWAIVIEIKATRLMAARKKGFSYIEDSPRVMTDEEQIRVFGEVDQANLCTITVLQDKDQMVARGYGRWPKAKEPYGVEKGNTKFNMSSIRGERQAIDRLVPDTLPAGVEVMDEAFMPPITVEPTTGEIVEAAAIVEPEVEQVSTPEADLETKDTGPPGAQRVYVGGQYGDMLANCWEHGEAWTSDKFQHLCHSMPDKTFCHFRNLLKPIVQDIAMKVGTTVEEINEKVKAANNGKTWSQLQESSQLEILTILYSQIPKDKAIPKENGEASQGQMI